jgi:hypothetical protein
MNNIDVCVVTWLEDMIHLLIIPHSPSLYIEIAFFQVVYYGIFTKHGTY